MARCAGTTLKGERCKREASEGSSYCSIHFEQPPEPSPDPATAPKSESSRDDPDFVLKAALGLAALAAIVLFRIRR
jgi:MYXO-CTERM domain-containing protein